MKRSTVFFDRLGVLIVGLAVLAVGAGAALWQQDRLTFAPDALDAGPILDLTEQPWWPWALIGAGVVVALLALWSLLRRIPSGRTRRIALSSSASPRGTVTLELTAVASRAAEVAKSVHGVKSARSRLRAEKTAVGGRTPVITVLVTCEPTVDPASIADEMGELRRQVAGVIGDAAEADARVGIRVLVSH